jgi:predicted transcriptional regulator of viral defense system
MEFERLLEIVGDEPVFETGLLLAGKVNPAHVRRQLSRWVKAGRIYQLRRGLYALAPPFQKVKPHPFVVANQLVRGSYVSLQSTLAYYGLIPEYVPVMTSVTTSRPGRWETAMGNYEFRHIQPNLLFGYRSVDVGDKQQALLASPEKALLDLIYLEPGADTPGYLRELRLQNLDQLDLTVLRHYTNRADRPKLQRATAAILSLMRAEDEAYETI